MEVELAVTVQCPSCPCITLSYLGEGSLPCPDYSWQASGGMEEACPCGHGNDWFCTMWIKAKS